MTAFVSPRTDIILQLIKEERVQQDKKWGPQEHTLDRWLVILMEEVGELAMAVNDNESSDRITEEAIQVAGVIVSMLEDYDDGTMWLYNRT